MDSGVRMGSTVRMDTEGIQYIVNFTRGGGAKYAKGRGRNSGRPPPIVTPEINCLFKSEITMSPVIVGGNTVLFPWIRLNSYSPSDLFLSLSAW